MKCSTVQRCVLYGLTVWWIINVLVSMPTELSAQLVGLLERSARVRSKQHVECGYMQNCKGLDLTFHRAFRCIMAFKHYTINVFAHYCALFIFHVLLLPSYVSVQTPGLYIFTPETGKNLRHCCKVFSCSHHDQNLSWYSSADYYITYFPLLGGCYICLLCTHKPPPQVWGMLYSAGSWWLIKCWYFHGIITKP